MEKTFYIPTEIKVNEKDLSRCSIKCQHIRKLKGMYNCLLFEQVIDGEIEDDDLGYGFQRTKNCMALAFEKEQDE